RAQGPGWLHVTHGPLVGESRHPAPSAPASFSLSGGGSPAGAVDYFLFHGGVTQGSQGNWYLRNELVAPPLGAGIPTPTPAPGSPPLPTPVPGAPPIPLFDPEVPLKSVLPSLAPTPAFVTPPPLH